MSGILNHIASPNSFMWTFDLLPLIIWYAVLPLGRTQHLVITCAACLMSQGMIGSLAAIFELTFSSSAILNVLATPSKLPIAFSIVPFESESPTRELSSDDP